MENTNLNIFAHMKKYMLIKDLIITKMKQSSIRNSHRNLSCNQDKTTYQSSFKYILY